MAGKFELFKDTSGEYRFRLKAANGEIILASEGYSVKVNAPIDARYARETSANDRHYFNLRAANHEVIGTSQMYRTAAGRENGIESVKANAPTAWVDDQT